MNTNTNTNTNTSHIHTPSQQKMPLTLIAFNGSPAGRNSATYRMIDAFLEGANQAGANTRQYLLADYQLNQCRGCFSCWFQTPGVCVMRDDMAELLAAYQSADIVCFASPVYSWNMTALLKNFVDRLIPLKSPLLSESNGRFDMQDTHKRQQQYITMANCGFPGANNFAIIKAAFSCCNPSLEIYRNCGKLLTSKQAAVQQTVSQYLAVLRQAGYEMAATGQVCPATQCLLQQDIMSPADYQAFLGM